MGLAASLDMDLIMFADNDPRTVSFRRRSSGDSYAAAASVSGVVREPLAFGLLDAAGAVLPRGSVAFHMQAGQVGARPKFGDRVVDSDGSGYSVDSCENLGEGTWYRAVCVPEV